MKNALGGTVNDVMLDVVAGGHSRRLRGARAGPGRRGASADRAGLDQDRVRAGHPRQPGGHAAAVAADRDRRPVARLARDQRGDGPLQAVHPADRGRGDRVGDELRARRRRSARSPGSPTTRVCSTCWCRTSRARSSRSTCSDAAPQTMYAGGFLAPGHALAVAAVSYDGGLGFGLISDPSVLPELDTVRAASRACFADLCRAADGEIGTDNPRPASRIDRPENNRARAQKGARRDGAGKHQGQRARRLRGGAHRDASAVHGDGDVRAGRTIFKAGEPSESFFVIDSGEVSLEMHDEELDTETACSTTSGRARSWAR